MSNKEDIWAEMGAGSTVSEGPAGRGPLLAILATLGVGAGLIFAAYQLGQKSDVTAPPLIEPQTADIRTAPENVGGTLISNTDNDAFRAIEGGNADRQDRVIADAVTVPGDLPTRTIDPAVAVETRDIIRETVDLTNIEMKNEIVGEPALDGALTVDRSDERLLAGGAEIAPPVENSEVEITAAGNRLDATSASDTSIVVADASTAITANTDASGSITAGTVGVDVSTPNLDSTGLQTRIAPSVRVDTGSTPNAQVTAADFADGGLEIAIMPRPKPDVGPSVGTRTPVVPAARPKLPEQRVIVSQPQLQQVAPRAINRAAPAGGVDIQVQLGAFPTQGEVRTRWSQIRGAHPDLLSPFGYKILPVALADGQQLFRLRVGPLSSMRNAAGLCEALRYRNVDCFVPPNQ